MGRGTIAKTLIALITGVAVALLVVYVRGAPGPTP